MARRLRAHATTETAYTLHVQLQEIDPPIWRRLTVPGELPLRQFHQVLQVTMGWYHSHLHQFIIETKNGTASYGEPDPEDDYRLKDDRLVRLAQIAPTVGTTFIYNYDFGDNWNHIVTVEAIETVSRGETYPWCQDGGRACPPEDVGGVSGYASFLDAWRSRSHPEHQDMRRWVGKHFKPELFSVQQVNAALCMLINIWSGFDRT